MRNRKAVLLGGLALIAPMLAHAAAEREGWAVVRQPAPEFAVKDLAGRSLSSASLHGKLVVIDFWATWCAPCLKELPELASWSDRLKDQKAVVFLSLNVTEDKDTVAAFVKSKQIAYPVYLGDSLLGPYEVNAFPTKLIIDMRDKGRGTLRFRRDGYTEVRSIEARLKELLEEPLGAPASSRGNEP